MNFNIGDRAVINDQFDPLVPYRDALIGQSGIITDQVPDAPQCLYIKLDNPDLRGHAWDGSWAVLAEELDKVEL
jgi:hypothetical protein